MIGETMHDERRHDPDRRPSEILDAERARRRDFLLGLGKWSMIVIRGVVGAAAASTPAQAGWVNTRGGGGAGWLNAR